MKLVIGALFLLGAEQAFAHALMIQFPNQDVASRILMPASLVFAVLGSIFLIWGLLAEVKSARRGSKDHPPGVS
jgi:hypothetical protein